MLVSGRDFTPPPPRTSPPPRHLRRPAAAASSLVAALLAVLASPGAALAQQTPPATPPSAAVPTFTAKAGTGTVAGQVFDSVSSLPLAGAMVQLVQPSRPEMAYGATTDNYGRFRIEDVAPGEYLAGFVHPALDSLGIESVPPARTRVAAGTLATLPLAVPSGRTLARAFCGEPGARDSVGALVGYVMDADAGTPLANAKVVVSWGEIVVDARGLRQEQRRAAAVTNVGGFYVHCRMPAELELITDATLDDRTSGMVELRVPLHGLHRRNFLLDRGAGGVVADSAPLHARGHARVQGRVFDERARPIAGAVVSVWGSDLVTKTGADGMFVLDSLPAGTRMVEARSIGYAPERKPADLSNARPATIGIMLERKAAVLQAVTIYGKSRRHWADIEGFSQRARRGMGGYFLTRDDIEQRRLPRVTDLLRTVPGVHVRQIPGAFGGSVTLRGNCEPAVYVDGTWVQNPDIDALMDAADLGAVEVYQGAGQTPVEFSARAGGTCGAVLLWSKR